MNASATFLLKILLCVLGVIFLSLSFLVYEDEERKFQSRVEDYWIRLDECRVHSFATENLLLARLSSRLGQMIDGIFGDRILSMRSAITSMSISPASFVLSVLLVTPLLHMQVERLLVISSGVVIVWAFGCILLARQRLLAALTLWVLPYLLVIFYLASGPSRSGEHMHDFTIFFGGLLLSLCTDLLVLAASRLLLRHAAMVRSTFRLFLLGLVGLVLLTLVCILPAFLAASRWFDQHVHPERRVYYRLLQGLTFLNASDLVVILGFLSVIAILFIHHAFWPSIQRPLYAIQRTGITAGRKSAASLGVGMISAGLGLTPIIEVIKKMFGG